MTAGSVRPPLRPGSQPAQAGPGLIHLSGSTWSSASRDNTGLLALVILEEIASDSTLFGGTSWALRLHSPLTTATLKCLAGGARAPGLPSAPAVKHVVFCGIRDHWTKLQEQR